MDTPSSAEVLLQDALTATTRRMRTSLLASSVLGLIIEKTGLVPSQIGNLGIEFTTVHKASLILIVLFAVVYFFVAFLIYALSDFSRWQLTLRASLLKKKGIENRATLFEGLDAGAKEGGAQVQDISFRQEAAKARLDKTLEEAKERYLSPYWQVARPLGWARAFLEFAFPLALGVYSMYLLVMLVRVI